MQYVKDAKLQIRTLAMIELTKRHTGPILAQEIKDVLGTYNLTTRNVYSLTADNAPNMNNIPSLLGDGTAESGMSEEQINDLTMGDEENTNDVSSSYGDGDSDEDPGENFLRFSDTLSHTFSTNSDIYGEV